MGSLFANKQNTQSTGTTNANTNTQNNLWNNQGLQDFLGQYTNQFTGPSINNVNPGINAFQTGAANNQVGVAGNPALGTGFNTASDISRQGFANQLGAFQNPFENQVVGNMLADFNTQNQQTLDADRGRRARAGALGNNDGGQALIMQGQQDAQARAIGNTRMQGFNTAAGLANQNAQAQLAGTGAIGNLTGASTGANQGLGNLGQNIWQSSLTGNMTPFQLYNQGAQGFQGFGNLAGTTVNQSGTSSNNSETTATPGLMQSLMGIAGLGMGAYNWWNQPGTSGQSAGGSWGRADGGAVKARAVGGPVLGGEATPFHEKVKQAFTAFGEMQRAAGGRTEDKGRDSYDEGGAVPRFGFMSPNFNLGQPEPERTAFPGVSFDYSNPLAPAFAPPANPFDQQTGAPVWSRPPSQFNGRFAMNPAAQFGWSDDTQPSALPPSNPVPPPATDVSSGDILNRYGTRPPSGLGGPPNANITAPPASLERMRAPMTSMSPNERFAAMLLAGSPIAGSGKALLDMHGQRIQEENAQLQADQLAQQLAQQNATMQLHRDQLAETGRHNLATEANRNQNRPETAFDVAISQASAKDAEARIAAVQASTGRLQTITNMENLLNAPGIPQGRFADWEVEGRRVANALFPGANLQGIPEAEAFRALSNQAALTLRSTADGAGMPGAMSDADRVFLMQSVPRLQNTPEGNRLQLRIMRDTEKYKIAANTEAQRYIMQRRTNAGLTEHMTAWMAQNPMARVVPEHTANRAEAERIAQANPAPPAPGANAADASLPVLTPEQALSRGLRPGARFRGTDGQVYTVPAAAPSTADVGVAP